MKTSHLLCIVCAIGAVTVVSGIVHGTYISRWGTPPDVIAAGKALAEVPVTFGDWEMESESEMEPNVVDVLQCAGYVFRTYVNQVTGQSVRIVIIVGPPGPTAVHIPEICYSSIDYTLQGERQSVLVKTDDSSTEGEFWAVTFRPNDLGGNQLRVYYAWGDGTSWDAVENPRVEFGARRVLYKLQISGVLGAPNRAGGVDEDACKSFLAQFIAHPLSTELHQ